MCGSRCRGPACVHGRAAAAAQKLLFGHSSQGDLLPYLSGHFDTTTGAKVDASSYTKIAKDVDVPPAHLLFVSDNVKGARRRRPGAAWTRGIMAR